jgi:hypothetical protein
MGHPPPNWKYRIGRRQRAALRAFIGYGPVLSTADLFRHVWPELDPSKTHPWWRWKVVRAVAGRWAVRMEPRSCPLRWRARPGVVPE